MDELLGAIGEALDLARRATGGHDAGSMTAAELMATNEALAALRRRVDAAHLPIAAEIDRQSRPELGRDSLAKRQGFRSPAALISATMGTSVGEAVRLVAVGEATAPRATLTGEAAPPRHPHVADALAGGRIGMPAASAIIAVLDRVALRAGPERIAVAEKVLAAQAPGLPLDQLQKVLQRAEAELDPEGVRPREEVLRSDRSLTIREERSGMVVMTGRFDPETAAPIKAAVEGAVTGMLRRRDEARALDESAEAPEVIAETRSVRQMQADALADLCRHAIGCERVPTAPSTTVVVRIDLADLQAATGSGAIDGIGQPVSAATVRRMAADAQVIPCVLGGESEILDWGRAKRLFTPAQKLALVERDGGCAFCGLPPSMTVVHHIEWWKRDAGPTDLSNGILLCSSCHHRIHDDGWEIRVEGKGSAGRVWFVPPPWLDAARTPRLGGRARFDYAATRMLRPAA